MVEKFSFFVRFREKRETREDEYETQTTELCFYSYRVQQDDSTESGLLFPLWKFTKPAGIMPTTDSFFYIGFNFQ